ncbi:MAG TPA: substrate-binding domain-containing protein [Burkholderiaceae bacterium]|nr:substrate-binding domain-containing protein [Burkholderiaceae bacterium]
MPGLHVLSAGAAKGLVQGLQADFERDSGFTLQCTFGAVGAVLERLNAGAPCDLIVLTRAMIDTLARDGRVDARIADLGWVHTGVAVPTDAAAPPVSDVASLLAVLEPSNAIYVPDPERATAGIHALRVLKALQLADIEPRLRAFPNGATAMAAMAERADARAVGITQVSEIRYTPGVRLLGVLPAPHGLATLYSGAVARGATHVDAAADLLQRLSTPERSSWRQQAGFEATSA